MSNAKVSETSSSKKKKKTWSLSQRDENDIRKSIDVRELDNGGYLVSTRESGSKKGQWYEDEKEFYSETNPLDGQESNEEKVQRLKSVENLFEPKFKQLLGED